MLGSGADRGLDRSDLRIAPCLGVARAVGDADDFAASPDKADAYAAQLTTLFATALKHAWLLTHRPVWALVPIAGAPEGATANATLQAAIRERAPAGLDVVLSGHLHDFMSYEFGRERPAPLVVGNSGDELFKLTHAIAAGTTIDGLRLRRGFASQRFGYLVLDRSQEGWRGIVHSVTGAVLARCRLASRSLQCR